MADLSSRTISSSYRELLKTSSSAGLTTELTVVEDGDATSSCLLLSTQSAKFTGSLTCEGSFNVLNTQESEALGQGSVILNGGLSVAKNLRSGGSIFAGQNLTAGQSLSAGLGLVLGDLANPSDSGADTIGLTIRGSTDKTIKWQNNTSSLGVSENLNLAAGKSLRINNINVLSSTTLGSGVLYSSLTSLGTVNTGVWQGTQIAGQYGGTGVNNSGKTITLGGNLITSGAHTTTLTTTGNTNITLPSSGTLATRAGSETLTNKTIDFSSNTVVATSQQIASAVTDETGSGALVFSNSPVLVTPTLGVASASSLSLDTPLPIASGGTGQTSAAQAINALVPNQSGQASKFLTTNGTTVGWASPIAAASAITTEQTEVILSDEFGSANVSNTFLSVFDYGAGLRLTYHDGTGGGEVVQSNAPRIRFSRSNSIIAGTNNQGQSVLLGASGRVAPLFVRITSASSNPSGCTLSSSSGNAGDTVFLFNGGGNPVNVYPPTGAYLDGQLNTPQLVPVGRTQMYACLATGQWFSFLPNVAAGVFSDVPTVFTKSQIFGRVNLTDAASITWNLQTQQVARVVLAGNRALANPSNKSDGGFYVLVVKQDATGSRTLSYGSDYYFSGGLPALSTAPNSVDILTFFCMDNLMYGSATQAFLQT